MHMPRRLAAGAAVMTLIAVGPRAAEAQITGSVGGNVHDASGAVLPGVTVTVRGPSLQKESVAALSGANGAYRVALIPPGVYDVTAALPGFTPQTRKDVEVAINQQTTLDFSMAVGGRSEAVEVEAEIPLVEVERSAVSARVSQQTIDALPLNGRNYVDLVSLVPGALPVPGGPRCATPRTPCASSRSSPPATRPSSAAPRAASPTSSRARGATRGRGPRSRSRATTRSTPPTCPTRIRRS